MSLCAIIGLLARYNLYMHWTDRTRQVKIILIAMALCIAVVSLVVSHKLASDLKVQEHSRMAVWAEAMRSLNKADDNTDLNLVLKVLNDNNTIPVIVLNRHGQVSDFRNLTLHVSSRADSMTCVKALGHELLAQHRNIRIFLDSRHHDYIDVCYEDSLMLKRLSWFPYVQLGVVLLFVAIAIFALLMAKKAEQNKVWVGLSKETAHQLGTPISSLMAWIEVLREEYPDDSLIPEMNKDVKRLQLIADRFSKIGSFPEPVPSNLEEVLNHVADYMDRRTSKSVEIKKQFPQNDIIVNLNASLFEWVIENLCKNAVDAMGGGPGRIILHVEETENKVVVEVSDTGKGIRKKDIGNVFRPGFTTKKRGWGLGLSLAKRIVEEYHGGKIFVKSSDSMKGTTFRIELKKT